MSGVPTPVCLAQKVGRLLGRREILFRTVPSAAIASFQLGIGSWFWVAEWMGQFRVV